MSPDHEHRSQESPYEALVREAVEQELLAGNLWQAALCLRENGLTDEAEQFEVASRLSKVSAMQCRIRAGIPLE